MGPGHLGVAPVNLFVLILLFGFVRLVFRLTFSQSPNRGQLQLKAPRPLKPRSAADCPLCRAQQLATTVITLLVTNTHAWHPNLGAPPGADVATGRPSPPNASLALT